MAEGFRRRLSDSNQPVFTSAHATKPEGLLKRSVSDSFPDRDAGVWENFTFMSSAVFVNPGSASHEKLSIPTISDVLQQQLGMKLEADTVPLDRFIVDSVQKTVG